MGLLQCFPDYETQYFIVTRDRSRKRRRELLLFFFLASQDVYNVYIELNRMSLQLLNVLLLSVLE